MSAVRKLEQWHQTIPGLLVFGAAELALMYGAGSWAIYSGRLLAWLLTAVLLIGVLQNTGRCIGKVFSHVR